MAGFIRRMINLNYLMEEGTCYERKEKSKVVTTSGYRDVPENNEGSLLKALANQPLSVAIEASGRDFQFYSGPYGRGDMMIAGVFEFCCREFSMGINCGAELDHGVAAVGCGSSSKGLDYIIVKNSWGPRWGDRRYIRVRRDTGKPEGLCGINKMDSYPTKNKGSMLCSSCLIFYFYSLPLTT